MIRIKTIIKKCDLDSYNKRAKYVTVLFNHSNKLKDKNAYKVYLYYPLERNILAMILGSAFSFKPILNESDKAFVTGIQSQKSLGYIKYSQLKKLFDIEQKYSISIAIPKKVKTLLKDMEYDMVR